jgi:hypothetical protein
MSETAYEPCGGTCAGLEAVLRTNVKYNCYVYSDTMPAARAVAARRIGRLQARYPYLLSAAIVRGAFTMLPPDVTGHLQKLQPGKPPLFTVEDATMQHNWKDETIRNEDFKPYARCCLGTPVTIDAA